MIQLPDPSFFLSAALHFWLFAAMVYSRNAQYVDCDQPVDRKGNAGWLRDMAGKWKPSRIYGTWLTYRTASLWSLLVRLTGHHALICQATIAIPMGNVERHFRTVYKKYDTDFPWKSELRKRKGRELSQLIGRQSFFIERNSQAKGESLYR